MTYQCIQTMKTKTFFAVAAIAFVSVISLCSFTSHDCTTPTISAPCETHVHAQGFGRCNKCYCKHFEGRGETCRNCGHAYRVHY